MRGFVFSAIAFLALAGTLCAQSSPGNAGQAQSEVTFLEPGKPVERTLQGGMKHIYAIRAETGNFIHAIVELRGIDVALTLYGPDSKPVGSIDENDRFGPEQISTIAETFGVYRLEVASRDKTVPAGRYRVTLKPLRTPSNQDRAHITAERMCFEAGQLWQEGSADSLRIAIQKYLASLPQWRIAGDRYEEALAQDSIGEIYSQLGQKQEALEYYNEALLVNREAGVRSLESEILRDMGAVYDFLGEMQKALEYYNKALPIQREVGDRSDEAATLDSIGGVYNHLGKKQSALEYYQQALAIWREVGAHRGEAGTLNNIGMIYYDLEEKQKALEYFQQALPIERAMEDRVEEAGTLNEFGGVYDSLGEKRKALDYYHQALAIWRAVGNHPAEAGTLNNIGLAYDRLGEKQKALEYYNQALAIWRKVDDRRDEAITLSHIGSVFDKLGEKQKALDYYTQSLPLSRAVHDPLSEASTLVRMMEYWKSLQNPSLAVLFGKQAIDRFQDLRLNIGGLEKEDQQSFLKSKEDYYRELAELLISAGRLPEAQQVLDLLKAEEYSEFTQRRGDTGSATNRVALTSAEDKSTKGIRANHGRDYSHR
ncbi:MAG: tetratricopeptide repeat protein [Candidatus Sulfotelmatobacter sp.]